MHQYFSIFQTHYVGKVVAQVEYEYKHKTQYTKMMMLHENIRK